MSRVNDGLDHAALCSHGPVVGSRDLGIDLYQSGILLPQQSFHLLGENAARYVYHPTENTLHLDFVRTLQSSKSE